MRWIGKCCFCVVITSLLFINDSAATMEMTSEEYALLPEYCHHKKWVSTKHPEPPLSRKWENFFGPDFLPVHHYCWALVWLARSYRSGQTSEERHFKLLKADGDIQFVLDNTSNKFPLTAELYTKQIAIRSMRNDLRNAEKAFQAAVAFDETYWPAYSSWGFWLSRKGRSQDAIKVVQEGLFHSPGNTKLESLLNEIRNSNKSRKE